MLEKNGNLELTQSEISCILSGEIPERIKQDWGDLTLAELLHIVDTQQMKVYTDGCN